MIKKFGKDFQNLTIDDKSYQLTTVATPITTLLQNSSLGKATKTGSATGNASKNHQIKTETNVTDVENDTLKHNSSASSLPPTHPEHHSISSPNTTLTSKRVHPVDPKKGRKRRHAEATHSFAVTSKIQTLPLYRVKNNVSQFRYSGRVSIFCLFCNSLAGPNTRVPILCFFSFCTLISMSLREHSRCVL